MNYKKLYSTFFFVPLLVSLLTMLVVTGCSEDDEALQTQHGYVQFKLYKSASFDKDAATRAMTDKLEVLKDAQKVKVVMQYNGATIAQTLVLNSYNPESAEFGLRSDKLQLLAGDYTIIGFYLYDKLDKELYAGTAGNDNTFSIVSGGLQTQSLTVDAIERGMVTFKLVKELIGTRAVAEEEKKAYPFRSIQRIELTVKNLFTQELTKIPNIRVIYTEDFKKGTTDKELHSGKNTETSYGECDTIVWLKAGSYQVSSYTTYSDKNSKTRLETASVKGSETFVVTDNKTTENVEVPIRQEATAEYIKDYIALRAIWESMGGEKWSYLGEALAPGCNWNFNKDIDMWGYQPGVQLLDDGRVAYISLAGFGASGDVPDEIGQLTELRVFALGTHSEKIGGNVFANVNANMTKEQKQAIRMDYDSRVLARDGREGLSDILKEGINRSSDMKPIKSRIATKDIQIGNLTNNITGISRAIMRLTNLEQLYIANSPISSDNFLKEVSVDSPYYEERNEWSWENMTKLLDIELYNCPNLTSLPMEILANLPELQSLNAACNKGIPAATLKDNWTEMAEGNCGGKLQILYLGYNNLKEFPASESLKKMKNLGLLDCINNEIEIAHPFGKEVNIVKLYLDNNKLTEIKGIEAEADQFYFSSYNDVEIMSFKGNLLTEVPDIFNGKSLYVMGTVDFSNNQITGFEKGDSHKGINAGTVDLSNNKLTKFPSVLFKTDSPVGSLNLSANGLKEIEKGALTGKGGRYLRSLDLTFNRLSELPDADFYATNLPYLYGLDLSYNSFSKFPYAPLDAATVTVFALRHQRDDDGNRTLREWPTGIYQCPSLVALYMGANDLRKIDDQISPYIRIFEIKDNPNISIDLSTVCPYINAGAYTLVYDRTQDIRGCDILDLEK